MESTSVPNRRTPPAILLGLGLVVLSRIVIQILLYQHGFQALTADDFGRTVMAAEWSLQPYALWSGFWLPLHMYLVGTALSIHWDLLWVPRVLTAVCGIASIYMVYLLTRQLFNNSRLGLISAALYSLNPAAIWLSAVPLSEMPYSTLLLTFLWLFIAYLQSNKTKYLMLGALALLLANGFRFESWTVSILFSLFLLVRLIRQVSMQKRWSRHLISTCLAMAIPWIIPLVWVIGNQLIEGDALLFLGANKIYKATWYGDSISFINYWKTFLKLDPYLAVLGLPALVYAAWLQRKSRSMMSYAGLVLLPLIFFILLHGGQMEPPGNYIRYMALFAFPLYPVLGFLVERFSTIFIKPKRLDSLVVILIVGLMAWTQLGTTFQFANDPAADGIAVGTQIKSLRTNHPELRDLPVIVERSYWQYLAIQVGADDVTHILFDRPLDIATRTAPSLIQTDLQTFKDCLSQNQVSTLVVKTPELQSILQDQLGLQPAQTVNGYAFFPIHPAYWVESQGTSTRCPLMSDP